MIKVSDASRATRRALVPVESDESNPSHVHKDSLSAQHFGKRVSNRQVDFPTDGDESGPVEIPHLDFELSTVNRRARFVHCVQIVGHLRPYRELARLDFDLGLKGTLTPLGAIT